MTRTPHRVLQGALAAALLAAGGARRAHATQFDVTSTADSGAGSLRAALVAAAANPGDDDVVVQPGLGTITLSSELSWDGIAGADAVVVEGNGVTVDFAGASRGFVDNRGKGVTIRNFTITGVGGSVDNDAAPVLSEGGIMVVDHCTISGNHVVTTGGDGAGAVLSEGGDVSIFTCTLTDNSAQASGDVCGAVLSEGHPVVLQDSTVTGNTADGAGDGGGGVLSEGGTINASNSLVKSNSVRADRDVGGGLGSFGGAVTVTGSTIDCNQATGGPNRSAGGGILCAGALSVDGSSVSGNRGTASVVGSPGKISDSIENFSGTPVLTNTTVTDDAGVCTVVVLPFFLPRTLTLKIAKPSSDKDALVGSGYIDDGGNVGIDYTSQPVTISIGGYSRSVTLVANAKRTKFTFKDAALNFVLTPNVRKASLGLFTIKVSKTPLGALIDGSQPVEFHFSATGLPDATGTVRLTNDKYKRGSRRGDIFVPHVFPAHVIVKLGGANKDSLTFRGGFASGGTAPATLGAVTFSFGDQFTRTIPGNLFMKAKNGDTYTYKSSAGGSKFAITVDFQRDFVKVDASKIELGPLSGTTTDVVLDAGDGKGAFRNVIHLSNDPKGVNRTY